MRFKRAIERRVREAIERHLEAVGECLEKFKETVEAYIGGDVEGAMSSAAEVHRLESEADSARREIQRGLYMGAFMPLLREDFLKLSELVDAAANRAEEACDQLVLERPDVPPEIRGELSSMVAATLEAFEELRRGVEALWESLDEALKVVRAAHEAVFKAGVGRVITTIRIDDRRDLKRSMEEKVESLLGLI